MSRIRANNIVNGAGTGAPTFPNGAIINGITTITADVSTTGNNLTIGTGTTISNPSDNEFRILTNGGERVRVNSSGKVGIGTDDPDERLEVGDGTVSGALKVSGQSSSVTSDGFTVDWESSSDSSRLFSEPQSGGSSQFKIYTTNSGTRSLAVTINSSGNLAFPSGQGIDFSATGDGSGTMTSELLDDYEEGTWEPYLSGTGGGSVTSFAERLGIYTRIGEVVVASFYITNPGSNSGVTDNWRIDGLPFGAKNYGNYYSSGPITYVRGVSSNGWLAVSLLQDSGTRTHAILWNSPNTTGETSPVTGSVPTNLILRGNIIYTAV